MEIDRYVFHGCQCLIGEHFHGHIIHLIVEVREEADWEVRTEFRFERIAIEAITLPGLISIQIFPHFVHVIFGTHLHRVLQMKLLTSVYELITLIACNEAVNEYFLIQLLHAFNTSIPDRRFLILIEGLALHRVVEHILELLVRNRIDLIAFTFVNVTESIAHVIDGTTVHISFIVNQHIGRQSSQD